MARPGRRVDAALRTRRRSNPYGEDFDYAEEFAKLDPEALKADVLSVITTSQDWWPADYGSYAGLFIRMSWHAAGTYRIYDGRGGGGQGMQRFAPLNSWPDNANLDKARRLLWPVKKKYGNKISWADLIIFAGNVSWSRRASRPSASASAVRTSGSRRRSSSARKTSGWAPTSATPASASLAEPYGATTMGLIYVNPEGPEGKPDPLAAAIDIRETFGRMAMNDEETAALIVGGHTLGKTHGAVRTMVWAPSLRVPPSSSRAWAGSARSAPARPATRSPAVSRWCGRRRRRKWSNAYLEILYGNEWELTKSPSRRMAVRGQGCRGDASRIRSAGRHRKPTMLVTDVSMRVAPIYADITRRWLDHPEELNEAFAKAWYKLLHRDMGPISRYLGPWIAEPQLWQDPVPAVEGELIDEADVKALKAKVLDSGLPCPQLVKTAWSSAAQLPQHRQARRRQRRARFALSRRRTGRSTSLPSWRRCCRRSRRSSRTSTAAGGKKVSLADLIVLAGSAAVEKAAKDAGFEIDGALRAGSHRRLAGEHRRGVVRGARTAGRRVPQLRSCRARRRRWSSC